METPLIVDIMSQEPWFGQWVCGFNLMMKMGHKILLATLVPTAFFMLNDPI